MTGTIFDLVPAHWLVHLVGLAMFGLLAYFWNLGKPSKLKAWIAVVGTFAGSVWMGWQVFFAEGGKFAVIAMLIFLVVFFLVLKNLNALRTREP